MANPAHADVVPVLRYRDARAAIGFLEEAFGFRARHVYDGPDGSVAHAELTFGGGLVMLSSRDAGGQEGGERLTWDGVTCVYVITDAVDEHHARAAAHGAEIVRPPRDMDYGGREYTAKDPDGNLWSFGSYRPEL